MKDRAVVVAVAGDAGGAAAVGPVIAHLRAGGVEVIALAYRQAASAWGPRGIAFDQLDEQISEDEVDAMLHRHGARALLTGTSVNGVDLERMFTRVCNRSDVPSVAVLDMWSTYSARFGAVEGKGADVPSRIAVMDSRARDAMLGEGFSAAQVVVTGHPGFDDLLCAWDRFGARERSEVRKSLGVSQEDRLLVFASQPLAAAWGEDPSVAGHAGYTERVVLDALLASLDRVAPRMSLPLTLLIRPHPREEMPRIPAGRHPFRILTARTGNAREVAMSADAVLGMCTMLLVESALLGIPTVSIQPGLRIADALPAMEGLLRVYDIDRLDAVMSATLGVAGGARNRPRDGIIDASLVGPTAAHRVASLLCELVAERS